MQRRLPLFLAALLAGGAWWFFASREESAPVAVASAPTPRLKKTGANGLPSSLGLENPPAEDATESAPSGAFGDEAVLVFANDEAYANFLKNLPKGVGLLSSSKGLRAVRLKVNKNSRAALRELLADAQMGGNFPVYAPLPPDSSNVLESGEAFRRPVLKDIGITGSRAGYGKGVSVAILDTGVVEHPALGTLAGRLDLVGDTGASEGFSGHGTAVASLIAGTGKALAGPAPEASLYSVRVLDSSGQGNTFTVAEGIVAAVDAGARILNLSLAGSGDSPALKAAVAYAAEHGAIIVAAAGNDGAGNLSYPAAYAGVISVGATDANGEHAPFSNTGAGLSLTAPGVGIPAAYLDGEAIAFTGTSAATPLVSGAIAAIVSLYPTLSPAEAAKLLVTYSNDTGAAGADSSYGSGIINVERVLRRNEAGLADVALASIQSAEAPGGAGEIYTVNVQNRGNVALNNVTLQLQTSSGPVSYLLPIMDVGQTVSQTLPPQPLGDVGQTVLKATVVVAGATDARPANDTKSLVVPEPSTATKAP